MTLAQIADRNGRGEGIAPVPWRKVVDHWLSRRHPTNGSQYRIFKLECGHTVTRKPSQGLPGKVRCRECAGASI